MANGWIIDKTATRRALIAVARERRHQFRTLPEEKVRVSESALAKINAATKQAIRDHIDGLPSKGRTIR